MNARHYVLWRYVLWHHVLWVTHWRLRVPHWVFALSVFASVQGAQAESRFVPLEHQIALSFRPQEVVFLVERGSDPAPQVVRVRGAAVPLEDETDPLSSSMPRTRYLLATIIEEPEDGETVRFGILIAGSANRFEFVPSRTRTLRDEDPLLADRDGESEGRSPMSALRSTVLEHRAKLEQQRGALKLAHVELEELRKKAQQVGNFEEILETQDEIRRLRVELAAATHYNASLEQFIEHSRGAPEPGNFVRRELQLTQQVAELIQATASIQRSAPSLKERQVLGSYEELSRELAELEKALATPSPATNPPPVARAGTR